MSGERGALRFGPLDPWTTTERAFDHAGVLHHASGSAESITIAESLPYLEPAAVTRLLLESFRVLAPGGRLELRLPDFVRVLDAWREGDARVVDGGWDARRWAQGWAARGVADDLDARTSAIFCTVEEGGYRGPAVIDPALVRTILTTKTPFRASVDLRRAAIDREPHLRFCRQNAYSEGELEAALKTCGFVPSPSRSSASRPRGADGESALETITVVASPRAAERHLREGAALFRAGHHEDAVASYQAAIAASPALAGEHYRLFYYVFVEAVRALVARREVDEAFARRGYRVGQLRRDNVERFVRSLAGARATPLAIEDHAPDFVHNPDLNERDLGEINGSHVFLALAEEQLDLAAPLIEELRAPLEACLRAPFRVVNVRCWRSHAQGVATQTNDWHNDEGFPADVLKVMIYLSGASETSGSTEVALASGDKEMAVGPPGTFLIFQNYALTHRGVMPREGERLVMEVTVVPSLASSIAPRFAGFNAEFPKVPW